MPDINLFRQKYAEFKQHDISDEEIIPVAKSKGYSDDEIALVISEYNSPKTQTDYSSLLQPNTMEIDSVPMVENLQTADAVATEGNPEQYVGEDYTAQEQEPVTDLYQGGSVSTNEDGSVTPLAPYDFTKSDLETEQPVTPEVSADSVQVEAQEVDPLTQNTFLGQDSEIYTQLVDSLIDTKNDITATRNDIKASLLQQAQELGYSLEEAEQVAEDSTNQVIKNFEISRYIQNHMYDPTTNKHTASRVESYQTLQKKFNLTQEETEYWNEQWKQSAPSAFDIASKEFDNASVGVKQDWYGLLALGGDLLGFGDSEVVKNAKEQIAQLDREATRINVERGSSFGAEDLSPIALVDATIASALALSSAPALAVVAGSAAVGAATSAIYAKGQGEDDAGVAVSATIGGALPAVVPAVAAAAGTIATSIRNFFGVKNMYKTEIASTLEQMPLNEANRVIDFFEKNKGVITEVSFFSKGSNSMESAKAFRAIGLFLRESSIENGIITINNKALAKGVNDTIKELKGSAGKLVGNEEGVSIAEDALANTLAKNVKAANLAMNAQIKKQYDSIDEVSANVFTTNSSDVMDKLGSFVNALPSYFPNDALDKSVELVGKKLAYVSERNLTQGGLYLKDLSDLQQSIKRDVQFNTPSSKQVLATINLRINEAKEDVINSAIDSLKTKQAASFADFTDADIAMLSKLENLSSDIAKANLDYREKLKHFSKQNIRKFIDAEVKSPSIISFVDDIVNKGDIGTLDSLNFLFRYVGKEEEFKQIGDRYILNLLKSSVSETTHNVDKNLSTKLDKFLRNDDLVTALQIPQSRIDDIQTIAQAISMASKIEQFVSVAKAPVQTNLGPLGYIVGHVPDLIRNIFVSRVYANQDLKKLVKEASEIQIKSREVLKELEKTRAKRRSLQSNFAGQMFNHLTMEGME